MALSFFYKYSPYIMEGECLQKNVQRHLIGDNPSASECNIAFGQYYTS